MPSSRDKTVLKSGPGCVNGGDLKQANLGKNVLYPFEVEVSTSQAFIILGH